MPLRALLDVPAPAKLNLFLHIVGRRADGYHLLQSVFVLIDWCDTLHLERRDDGRLQRHDLGPPLPPDDLCLRAARALQAASGTAYGADISIAKQVPWGAGLGGGSSDAASTLLALNRLWGLHWPRSRLAELALPLGADVPFFIGGDNALVQGVGERLSPMAVAPARYAVVKPAASIATRELFQHPALKRDTEALDEAAILLGSLDGDAPFAEGDKSLAEAGGKAGNGGLWGRNDLQAAAQACCPAVTQALHWLQQHVAPGRMTGSGSAVFARWPAAEGEGTVFGTGTHADMGAPSLATFPAHQLPPGWVGRLCLGLPRHPLQGWAA